MKAVIIFGNDHTNSVGLIHSMGQAGYECIALLFGVNTGFVRSSKYVKRIITAADAQSCIDKLLDTDLGIDQKEVIIAGCDSAALTLERNSERLKDRFYFEYATNYTLEQVFKKELQVQLAKEAGFNVPKSWTLNDRMDIPSDVCFPCLIKPLVSCEGAKADIRVCRDVEELKYNLNTLKITKNVLLQQYIERDFEISILGCSLSDGDCIIPAVENKLTLYPKNVGLECLSKMEKLTDEEIIRNIRTLLCIIGYVGLFSVEMMHCKKDGNFYFTEINLRNDGANSFVTKYGANLPLYHVEDMTGQPITDPVEEHPGYYIWEMHHFLSLLHREISLKDWSNEIRKSRGFLCYMSQDKKPFFKQFSNFILRKLHLRKERAYN